MAQTFLDRIGGELREIDAAGLTKRERVITSPQAGRIHAEPGGDVLNFCANNYLGLADHPDLVAAAKEAIDRYGYGMASVRFICGTQEEHKALEARLAGFLGMEDAILYGSCFDANTGLFETLLGPGGRDHLGRAQPRLDHRRRAAVQGPTAIATPTTTWRNWKRG